MVEPVSGTSFQIHVSALRALCLLLAWSWVAAMAQGGSAIITLVMPPPGGAGYASLQSGAAFPDGAASLYYNPATLPEISRATGSQINFTRSDQYLLPVLGLQDLSQNFWAITGVIPDPKTGTDIGIGFFRNSVNFGQSENTDANSQRLGTYFNSNESVYGLGLGIRLGVPISLGGTVKFIDSHLNGNDAYDAISWAFDLGVLIDPKFQPFKPMGLSSIDIVPSLGMSCKNIGPRVFYTEPHQSDPLPTTYVGAVGMTVHFADIIEFETGRDMDHEITNRTHMTESGVKNSGFSVSILGYRYSTGWLDDPLGKRRERHISRCLDLNALSLYRLGRRVLTGDFLSARENLETGYPFLETKVLGISFRANPHIIAGWRRIHSPEGIREGQESMFINIAL